MSVHIPVLLREVLEVFARPMEVFLDCTVGLGGHAEAILKAHPEIKSYIGCDQDAEALEIAQERLGLWKKKVRLIHTNFTELQNHAIAPSDGILADIGVSSLQLDRAERGFSFRYDAPLDMRMDKSQSLTAAEIINEWSEADLGRIFRQFGEERRWKKAAHAIVKARPIHTTKQLVDLLSPLLPPTRNVHPLTLIFQALRIAVNRELDALASFLPWAIENLRPKGRLAVITFHSLEDRIVKRAFQWAASDKIDTSGVQGLFLDKEPLVVPVTRKAVACSDEEAFTNPRARSAKLRAVERLP